HDDIVYVSSAASSVQAVRGRLDVTQAAGQLALLIDDSGDAVSRNVTLTRGAVIGLAPATIAYDEKHLRTFSVRGGGGGNQFTVLGTPDNGFGMPTALGSGAGTDIFTVKGTAGPLQADGGGGIDIVNIGDLGLLTNVLGAVTLANPTGQTVLNIFDDNDPAARIAMLDSNGLTFQSGPAAISWPQANLMYLFIHGGFGGNTFIVNSFANVPLATHLESGAGNDTVFIAGGTGSFYLEGDAG